MEICTKEQKMPTCDLTSTRITMSILYKKERYLEILVTHRCIQKSSSQLYKKQNKHLFIILKSSIPGNNYITTMLMNCLSQDWRMHIIIHKFNRSS